MDQGQARQEDMQKEKLTVLIPFRNREENLKVFSPYFHNFMKTNFENINYEIVVVEQGNDKPFNKGILFNAGFLLTSGNTDYYALHDVDALPISADYSYRDKPYHIYVNNFEQGTDGLLKNPNKDKFGYQNCGGANIIDKNHYLTANGHSVNYWGWGTEDDDFKCRLNYSGIGLWRKNITTNDNGYFISLNAKSIRFNANKYHKGNVEYCTKIINREIDWKTEGLNTTKFELLDTIINDGYTKYVIDFENDIKIDE
jgi:hypothetical protein